MMERTAEDVSDPNLTIRISGVSFEVSLHNQEKSKQRKIERGGYRCIVTIKRNRTFSQFLWCFSFMCPNMRTYQLTIEKSTLDTP